MNTMTLSEELQWRGSLKDHTFSEVTWLDTPRTFYLGVDCTSADSMTVGNLAVFMLARRLRNAGWKAVLLVGGATSLIGDPGGKDEERTLKTRDEIAHNVAGIKGQMQRLFDGEDFTLVDNYDWFKEIGFLEFLRDVGKNYSMTELVQRDFIADRMGEGKAGISYAEFSYTLVQGYDFWHLFKNHGVELQVGGSDQWGNMLSGVPLIRKKEAKEVHAMSIPLVINKATGKKFGKSEGGAVWLDAARTTPTQFFQFWINVDDDSVEDYLKVFTVLTKPEIEAIMAQHQANPRDRIAQTKLAEAVTEIVHGPAEVAIARAVTSVLTNKTPVGDIDDTVLASVRTEIASATANPGGSIIDILEQTGLASSKSEARRLLTGNAIAINGVKTSKEQFEEADFQQGRLLLRKGKAFKDSALIERN